jgi:hypothetical protein
MKLGGDAMSESTTSDCLHEIVAKLRNGGLPQSDISRDYVDREVAPGISAREFLKLLQLEGSLIERDDRLYLKT